MANHLSIFTVYVKSLQVNFIHDLVSVGQYSTVDKFEKRFARKENFDVPTNGAQRVSTETIQFQK